MDPLDRSIQVEERLRPPHAVNSSDTQTESLGKLGREPIDSNLDWRGRGGSRAARTSFVPLPTAISPPSPPETARGGGRPGQSSKIQRSPGAPLRSYSRPSAPS